MAYKPLPSLNFCGAEIWIELSVPLLPEPRFPVALREVAQFDTRRLKPLEIGIHHKIQADLNCDPAILARALRCWCASKRYLKLLSLTEFWVPLAGATTGPLPVGDRVRGALRRQDERPVRIEAVIAQARD